MTTLLAHPAIGTRYRRTRCRQYILPRFPYSLIYREDPGILLIGAVHHHSRRPGYWIRRFP